MQQAEQAETGYSYTASLIAGPCVDTELENHSKKDKMKTSFNTFYLKKHTQKNGIILGQMYTYYIVQLLQVRDITIVVHKGYKLIMHCTCQTNKYSACTKEHC